MQEKVLDLNLGTMFKVLRLWKILEMDKRNFELEDGQKLLGMQRWNVTVSDVFGSLVDEDGLVMVNLECELD